MQQHVALTQLQHQLCVLLHTPPPKLGQASSALRLCVQLR
jgi:hypothetical protein